MVFVGQIILETKVVYTLACFKDYSCGQMFAKDLDQHSPFTVFLYDTEDQSYEYSASVKDQKNVKYIIYQTDKVENSISDFREKFIRGIL